MNAPRAKSTGYLFIPLTLALSPRWGERGFVWYPVARPRGNLLHYSSGRSLNRKTIFTELSPLLLAVTDLTRRRPAKPIS